MKHLLKLMDLSKEEIDEILDTADKLKYEKIEEYYNQEF